jgi:hypothetical protein
MQMDGFQRFSLLEAKSLPDIGSRKKMTGMLTPLIFTA